MVKATIYPSRLQGHVHAPASKSSMQRACALALITKGTTYLQNPGHSNDDRAAMEIIRALGAVVVQESGMIRVDSRGVAPVSNKIHCGESGLGIRMFTPLAALSAEEILITGEGSLESRPMDFFDDILPRLGVSIQSSGGKLPLRIKGPLKPANIEVDGSLSSQFLTGLILAYAAAGASDVSIRVNNLKSRPYIDLTLDVMQQFGMPVPENRDYREFHFPAVPHIVESATRTYGVEADWSGGAFLLVAGAIAGPVLISGLDLGSTQADRAIIDALMAANAGIAMEAKGIRMVPGEMNAFDFDATDCPDLFPPLVALAAYCKGKTTIRGVSRLVHKESNRALTLQDEFDQMGVTIELDDDVMTVHGGRGVKGADVSSHHDHRIAMACAVAGLGADSEMVIDHADAVNKSYPDFYEHLQQLGARVSISNKLTFHE